MDISDTNQNAENSADVYNDLDNEPSIFSIWLEHFLGSLLSW